MNKRTLTTNEVIVQKILPKSEQNSYVNVLLNRLNRRYIKNV